VGGIDYEALWFNVSTSPFNSKAVRQAVGYALDRAAMATQLVGSFTPPGQALQSFVTPASGDYYDDTFSKYRLDASTVGQLMGGDGWAKGGDGIWAKGDQKATIDLKVSADDALGMQSAQAVMTQLQGAGFAVTIDPEPASTLFGRDLPSGSFSAAIYPMDLRRASGASGAPGVGIVDADPGLCWLFCSTSIPGATTTEVGSAGAAVAGNYTRVSDAPLDRYLLDLDANVNDSARLSDANQAATILADLVPALPLVTIPDVLVVNTGKLAVEGGTFNHNLAYSPYAFLNEWYLKTGS